LKKSPFTASCAPTRLANDDTVRRRSPLAVLRSRTPGVSSLISSAWICRFGELCVR
jgi:hypothetical protein